MFKDLIKEFPHVDNWLENHGSIILGLNGKSPSVYVYDRYGFVWENQIEHESFDFAFADLDRFLPIYIENEKKRKKYTISIESFVFTGKFGPVELGISRREVEELFGLPETYLCFGDVKPHYTLADTWYYGNWEIEF